jgi:hypothetical protein
MKTTLQAFNQIKISVKAFQVIIFKRSNLLIIVRITYQAMSVFHALYIKTLTEVPVFSSRIVAYKKQTSKGNIRHFSRHG